MKKRGTLTAILLFAFWHHAALAAEGSDDAAPPGPPSPQPPANMKNDLDVPRATSRNIEKRIKIAVSRLAAEPTLEELERAALKRADADVAGTKGWMRAPNVAAILPTLKITADYDMGRDEALDRYQDEPDRWGADTDRKYGFQLSAQWELDKLIFNSDEVRVYSALADRSSRRENLLAILISYYFERRRLQIESLLKPPTDLAEAFSAKIRIDELTASIDALTGGLLSSKLKSKTQVKSTRQRGNK